MFSVVYKTHFSTYIVKWNSFIWLLYISGHHLYTHWSCNALYFFCHWCDIVYERSPLVCLWEYLLVINIVSVVCCCICWKTNLSLECNTKDWQLCVPGTGVGTIFSYTMIFNFSSFLSWPNCIANLTTLIVWANGLLSGLFILLSLMTNTLNEYLLSLNSVCC